MKPIIAVVLLAASITGANAAPVDRRVNVQANPAALCHSNGFCPGKGSDMVLTYDDSEIHGDIVVWGCHGCAGEMLEGLPSWLRKVPTSYGYNLVGRPRPGVFKLKSYYDGEYKPTLDETLRFVPR